MLEDSLKILERINQAGYSAYLVGGFVRDYLLGIESNDIDICTNAKPKELLEIFENAKIPKEDYGAVTIYYKNVRYEITTFRKEVRYRDCRHPEEIIYINSLEEDLIRRDFTINTLCMDSAGNIIDLFQGEDDLEHKIIKTVGNSYQKFSEDALRILRAVRFAAKLHFSLDSEVIEAIKDTKHLLKNISYQRKKEELDKIFTCSNIKYGIELLLGLGLENDLEIPNLSKITYTDSLVGIWAVLDSFQYPFTNNEKKLITSIQEALIHDNLDPYYLYLNGLYVNSVAASIKGISNNVVAETYARLPIHNRGDLKVHTNDLVKAFNRKPGPYLKGVYERLERDVLYERVQNEQKTLIQYCMDNYQEV